MCSLLTVIFIVIDEGCCSSNNWGTGLFYEMSCCCLLSSSVKWQICRLDIYEVSDYKVNCLKLWEGGDAVFRKCRKQQRWFVKIKCSSFLRVSLYNVLDTEGNCSSSRLMFISLFHSTFMPSHLLTPHHTPLVSRRAILLKWQSRVPLCGDVATFDWVLLWENQ